MSAMNSRWRLFGSGEDVSAAGGQEGARVMKKVLWPICSLTRSGKAAGREVRQRTNSSWRTVKGDVHDIGKNIVGVCWAQTIKT